MGNSRLHRVSIVLGLVPVLAVGGAVAHRNDVLAELSPGNVLGLTLDGVSGLTTTREGSVSLSTDDPFCVPTAAAPCVFSVNYVSVTINDFVADTNVGNYRFEQTSAIIRGPLLLVNSGGDLTIPIGTPVEVGAVVSGPEVSRGFRKSSTTTTGDLFLRMSPIDGILTLDGTIPFNFRVPEIDQSFAGSISGLMDGLEPFVNTAPFARAQDYPPLTCPQLVTLQVAESSDFENNINAISWQVGGGVSLFGASPSVFLDEGTHVATLSIDDFYGGLGSDQTVITIVDPPPVFTFVPGPVETQGCGAVALGTPTATQPCGPVTVTNDAPAFFTAGRREITWTATSVTGKTVTAAQTVVVWPDDSPSCCPAGSNVIIGTPNNDELSGTSGPDCIIALGGQDTINAAGGDDVISGGHGDDVISGGGGNDMIAGGPGQDQLFGQDGDDVLGGLDGDDSIDGGSGNDYLSGGQGQDQLVCGAGADQAFGGTGDDRLFGNDGDDLLDGQNDNDVCTGGAGFDTLLSCTAQDNAESTGSPAFPGDAAYEVCSCKPDKCIDCSSQAALCQATAGCRQIIQCINVTGSCNLPHECSGLCETGRSALAIERARQLASCFGGC